MSTKNLARTVIEGGREYSNCWFRRSSNRTQRLRARQICATLLVTRDYDRTLQPKRQALLQSFHDKLGPAYRFLASQVGRPWRKVRSELFQRFDARTTAGRHILFDHLLRSVHEVWPAYFGRRDFYVDRHGLLRRAPLRKSSKEN